MHPILLERAAVDYPHDHPVPLRFLRSSSAPIAPTVADAVEATFHAPLLAAYGMTLGEVQVTGPSVTAGYLDGARANANAFVDGGSGPEISV